MSTAYSSVNSANEDAPPKTAPIKTGNTDEKRVVIKPLTPYTFPTIKEKTPKQQTPKPLLLKQ